MSKYTITRTPEGFTVEGTDRQTTIIQAAPTGFIVGKTDDKYPVIFGLYEYYRLSSHIADCLMQDWKRPDKGDEYTPMWLNRWARQQTAKSIGKRVYAEWLNLIGKADPAIRELQKRLFSIVRTCPQIAHDLDLYKNPIVRDAMKYRAAAIAILIAGDLADKYQVCKLQALEQTREFKRLQTMLAGVHLVADRKQTNILDILPDWRGLYSNTGQPYRSLDRTLMNLPGRVPLDLMQALCFIRLPRPMTDRLELTVLLEAVRHEVRDEHNFFDDDKEKAIKPLWYHARRDQIIRAMKHVSEHIRQELSPNRNRDVIRFVDFVRDGEPKNYTGGIVGAADRSIEYHKTQLAERRAQVLDKLGGDTRTAQPAISLPQLPGITFLDTVGRVVDEGATMNHCIADYAQQAISGESFLFHVEKAGEHATVEVGYEGRVRQSHGPSNRDNAAARWGKRVLNNWGAPLASLIPAPVAAGLEVDDDLPF